jgi:hypothetical protein
MNLKLFFTGLSLCLAGTASALPTLYPSEALSVSSVLNTTNSNLIADHRDPRLFHVMPPMSGKSVVSGIHTITSHVGFCEQMSSLQRYSARMVESLNAQYDRRQQQEAEYLELENRLNELLINEARYLVNDITEALQDMDRRIEQLDMQIEETLEQITSCSVNCSELRDSYRDLRNLRRAVYTERRDFVRANNRDVRLYEQSKRRVELIEKRLEDANQRLSRTNQHIVELNKTFIDTYKFLGEFEGGRAKISYKSNWDENIATLREENPHYSFQKIETRNAVLYTSISDLRSIPSNGAILGYDIGGRTNEHGVLELPAYVDQFGGNIRLSLIGACPLLFPEKFEGLSDRPGLSEMSYSVISTYEYPTLFVTSAEITYNMYKMYERLQTEYSRGGGLFRSRKRVSLTQERNIFRDSFKVEWRDHLGLAQEEKDKLEQDMLDRLYMRLAQIGLPHAVQVDGLPMPTAPESGAIVLAEGLKRICPSSAICQGVSLGASVLDALFSRTVTSTTYRNIQDVSMVERWSNESVYWRPWITSFDNN